MKTAIIASVLILFSCHSKKEAVKKDNGPSSNVEFPTSISLNAAPEKHFCIKVNGHLCKTCYTVTIFNRWGKEVWKSNDPKQCWNGIDTNTQQFLPQDVYMVIVKTTFNKENYTNTGTVTLLH